MDQHDEDVEKAAPEILAHYESVDEGSRLEHGVFRLEQERTRAIVRRWLPVPPATVLDVGGGPGAYARWLARLGYAVHLIDPVARHVEQALGSSEPSAGCRLAGAVVGDARRLERPDASVDAVLLLGPLYHLTRRDERDRALAEARRVLKPGGVLFAAAISRFASLLDGLSQGFLEDPVFAGIVDRDLGEGQHRNPTGDPRYFTTAYFHRPEDLRAEIEASGLALEALVGIEGVGWLLRDLDRWWSDPARREHLLARLATVECEPSMLGASAHLMAVARKRT